LGLCAKGTEVLFYRQVIGEGGEFFSIFPLVLRQSKVGDNGKWSLAAGDLGLLEDF